MNHNTFYLWLLWFVLTCGAVLYKQPNLFRGTMIVGSIATTLLLLIVGYLANYKRKKDKTKQ